MTAAQTAKEQTVDALNHEPNHLVDLDALSANDLAHLVAIKRQRERGIPRLPCFWRPDGSEPDPPDPETMRVFERRVEEWLGLVKRTTTAAQEMAEGRNSLPPLADFPFTLEEVAHGVTKTAVKLGLSEDDAMDAVTAGIRAFLESGGHD